MNSKPYRKKPSPFKTVKLTVFLMGGETTNHEEVYIDTNMKYLNFNQLVHNIEALLFIPVMTEDCHFLAKYIKKNRYKVAGELRDRRTYTYRYNNTVIYLQIKK